MRFLPAALGFALPFAAAKVSYDGYKAFRIDDQLDYAGVQKALSGMSFISLSVENARKGVEIAVAPESIKAFEALGLNTHVVHEDLGADIALEGQFKPYRASVKAFNANSSAELPDISYFNSYHELADHHQFLDDISAYLPDNSETFVAGKSVEGRDIKGIHLYGKEGAGKKPAIIWHGNVHAREWITGVTVEYLLYKIAEGYKKTGDESTATTLDNYDFYIIPVVNPDGFVYTTAEDRMWRKNRQVRQGKTCVGTDMNRNWPNQWDIPGGSSPEACSETYRGEAAGDTPEIAALTNHTLKVADAAGIKWYVDWHSYSQLILTPYGYDCNTDPANLDRQLELAGGLAKAIKSVHGVEFVYGPTCKTIYQAAGGSMDWVYDIAEAELAWGIELRPGSDDSNGFVLPPDQIVPSGEEQWAGAKWVFANF
uniref:Carboxypeptidase M14A n=1 Tax=Bionectria ochroleuca TaxID=29856 RepID=A0A0B7K461_BIOOC